MRHLGMFKTTVIIQLRGDHSTIWGALPWWHRGKNNSPTNAGDTGWILDPGRAHRPRSS